MIIRVCLLVVVFSFFSFIESYGVTLFVTGKETSDIITVLKLNGIKYRFVKEPSQAIVLSEENDAILMLSDGYPIERVPLSVGDYRSIYNKRLRVFVEYPGRIENLRMAVGLETSETKLERGIINTTKISGLDSLKLLSVNHASIIHIKSDLSPLAVISKVAGFDSAEYGYHDVPALPLLIQSDNIMVASTRISEFAKGRFAPERAWKGVWQYIVGFLLDRHDMQFEQWESYVSPTFSKDDKISKQEWRNAAKRGVDWFYKAKFLVDSSWYDKTLRVTDKDKVVFDRVDDLDECGDGSLGILEGHSSYINNDGTQPYRWWIRADCQAESAYALSSVGVLFQDSLYLNTAERLLSYLFEKSNMVQSKEGIETNNLRGLIGWATTNPDVFYGDDNARIILASIGTRLNLDNPDLDSIITESILGNFRTAGKYGFRGGFLRDTTINKTGLKELSSRELINIHPHYESWLWACYIWLYHKTGHKPLLEKAKHALRICMENEEEWKWTNGIQQERARLILPLAWLVRIEDTPEHRKWLYSIVNQIMVGLQSSGAIREEIGAPGKGSYEKVRSNSEYGLHEAPLISNNGDPVSDLLYTTNFAFFSLNEAAHALNDSQILNAVNKMAEYLTRIQVKSAVFQDLDGAWFRAFDYENWEYWASNADSGWGPWGTLTGWTQSWIVNTMLLVEENSSFWGNSEKLKRDSGFTETANKLIIDML